MYQLAPDMMDATEGVTEIMIGTVATDSIHADGTPNFLNSIERLVQCELPDLSIVAPAIEVDTLTLVKNSQVPKDLLGWIFLATKKQ